MLEPTRTELARVAQDLQIKRMQVESVVQLLDEGNTVPFITRYRKEQTGNLDEEQIRGIQRRAIQIRQLAERKQTVLRTIESQGKLTDELRQAIEAAGTSKRLEDLYLPYKPKKQTLATIARQRGLEPLAEAIWTGDEAAAALDDVLPGMLDSDKQLNSPEDVLAGVRHILAERISEDADAREAARRVVWSGSLVTCKAGASAGPAGATGPEKEPESGSESGAKPAAPAPARAASSGRDAEFRNYFSYSEPVKNAPPHRVLAINRGEKLGALKVRVETDGARLLDAVLSKLPLEGHPHREFLVGCANDAIDRLLSRSLEREVRSELTEVAERHAIGVFARNVRNLLLQPPVRGRRVLAIDPGFRTGCKYAVLDEIGNLLTHGVIYPHSRRKKGKKKRRAKPKEAAPQAAERLAPEQPLSEQPAATGEPAQAAQPEPVASPPAEEGGRTDGESQSAPGSQEQGSVALENENRPQAPRPTGSNETTGQTPVEEESPTAEEGSTDPEPPEEPPPLPADSYSRSTGPGDAPSPGDQTGGPGNRPRSISPAEAGIVLPLDDPVGAGSAVAEPPAEKPAPPRPSRWEQSRQTIVDLCREHNVTVVAVGNGSGCRETEELVSEAIRESLPGAEYVIVNEAGASVYSASAFGREEFPDYDATLRGTISIGRRLQDPLSELVKIDPQHIGVGLYQHDVNPRLLKESLNDVVESCVNYVGVDLNTASVPLLQHVSGLNQLRARNIVEHRKRNGPFSNREQLKEVSGVGPAVFTQAAGFLKITGGDVPFDGTWIHPESYAPARQILELLGYESDVLRNRSEVEELHRRLIEVDHEEIGRRLDVGVPTVRDILDNFVRPGRDPRDDLPKPIFKTGILKLEDLTEGMQLRGAVLNVVDFGVFVDVGLKDSCLVHISQLANRYVRDPHDIVGVGATVTTWVLNVDRERRRVSLTMIEPGTKRPPPQREKRSQTRRRPPRPAQGERKTETPAGEAGAKEAAAPATDHRPRRGARPPRRKKPKRSASRQKPSPPVHLSDEALKGKTSLHTFGELKAFFEHQKKKQTGSDDEKNKKEK